MVIQIVPIKEISFENWQSLWKEYLKYYKSTFQTEVTQNTWKKLTSNTCPHVYGFAAIINEDVVGIVHVVEHDSCWTISPYAYLQDLFTQEKYRGQGVARKLIEEVEREAKNRKCDRVYWMTHESNEQAQILYNKIARKTGFIQYRL